jgi:hypothetical protein
MQASDLVELERLLGNQKTVTEGERSGILIFALRGKLAIVVHRTTTPTS